MTALQLVGLKNRPKVVDLTDDPHPGPNRQNRGAPGSFRPLLHHLLLLPDLIVLAILTGLSGAPPVGSSLYAIGLVGWLAVRGSYRIPMPPSWLDVAPQIVRQASLPSVVFLLFHSARGSRQSAMWLVIAAVASILMTRLLSLAAIRASRKRGLLSSNVIIVGGGEVGSRIAQHLTDFPEYGLRVRGYVDAQRHPLAVAPYLGPVEDLDSLMGATESTTVIVTFTAGVDSDLVEQLRWTASNTAEVLVVPRLFDVAVARTSTLPDHIRGVPVVAIRQTPQGTMRWAAKRAFDIVATVSALLVLWPLLILIGLAVRLSSPGPALFRQTRVGKDSAEFGLLKFRSMRVNDDSDTTWDVSSDDRVTPIGRFLRRSCLDELPQLFNVVKGDMSLVGPRPERPNFVEKFTQSIPSYDARHRVPVGLTGWAQVEGLRGDTSIEDRARYDNAYVERWSVWRDVTILLRTVATVFRRPT